MERRVLFVAGSAPCGREKSSDLDGQARL